MKFKPSGQEEERKSIHHPLINRKCNYKFLSLALSFSSHYPGDLRFIHKQNSRVTIESRPMIMFIIPDKSHMPRYCTRSHPPIGATLSFNGPPHLKFVEKAIPDRGNLSSIETRVKIGNYIFAQRVTLMWSNNCCYRTNPSPHTIYSMSFPIKIYNRSSSNFPVFN